MFEQESYDRATAPTVSQPGELFHNYEIRSWFFTPALYKVLAIAAVLNLAFLAGVSQTNVLTARGCDSPWVGRVCQVVDMAYVGALLFGTEREFADVEYERTELSPDDEITYIIETPESQPLDYPQGYFQVANPVQFAMLQQQAANGTDLNGVPMPGVNTPGFSTLPNNDSDLLKQRANPPAANPNAFSDDSSTSDLFKVEDKTPSSGSFSQRKGRGGKVGRPSNSNSSTGTPDETIVAGGNTNTQPIPPLNPAAEPVDEAKADQFGVFINKRPLKDRAKETIVQVAAKDLKLDKSFKVVIEGTLGLGKDGKTTVLKNPKLVPVDPNVPNDPEMVKLAQEWILAVGDAGWYAYLDRLDDKTKVRSGKVIITIEQNDAEFIANIKSEKASDNAAKSIASGLGLLLQAAASAAKGDEQIFLKGAEKTPPTSDGKMLILNFTFPKPVVQEMIQRKLAEAKEPKAEPNSTALGSAKSTTAIK